MTLLLLLSAFQVDSLYVWSEAKEIAAGKPHEELLAFCAQHRVPRLYFMASGKEDLSGFLKAAHAAKLSVFAMHPGDMDEWLKDAPDRFNAAPIVDWCVSVLKQPFDGIHLDIEPAGSPLWKKHAKELSRAYLELLVKAREKTGKLPLTAAIPHWWDREELALEFRGAKKPLVNHVIDLLDTVSIMAYRGAKAEKVLEAIAHECAVDPARVELVQETDTSVVEEGVPLHVGTHAALVAILEAARKKHPAIRIAVHHYTSWRTLPAK